jgi:hypothetical protein
MVAHAHILYVLHSQLRFLYPVGAQVGAVEFWCSLSAVPDLKRYAVDKILILVGCLSLTPMFPSFSPDHAGFCG